jgi:hypothetical protein
VVYLGDELGSVPWHRAAIPRMRSILRSIPFAWLHAPVTTASLRAGATIGHG